MLSPCPAPGEKQYVVVELCEDIVIDTVQLANFEFFSGVFREFTVSVAKTHVSTSEGPGLGQVGLEEWTVVGTYVGRNLRGVQVRLSLRLLVVLSYTERAEVLGFACIVFPPTNLHTRLLPLHPYRLSFTLRKRVLLPHISPPCVRSHTSRAMEVGRVGGC